MDVDRRGNMKLTIRQTIVSNGERRIKTKTVDWPVVPIAGDWIDFGDMRGQVESRTFSEENGTFKIDVELEKERVC